MPCSINRCQLKSRVRFFLFRKLYGVIGNVPDTVSIICLISRYRSPYDRSKIGLSDVLFVDSDDSFRRFCMQGDAWRFGIFLAGKFYLSNCHGIKRKILFRHLMESSVLFVNRLRLLCMFEIQREVLHPLNRVNSHNIYL